MLFLMCKPNLNKVWWQVLSVYKMTNEIFKNLCEGNHQDMKNWLSTWVPICKNDPEFNPQMMTYCTLK
jgi:hypothetical protein